MKVTISNLALEVVKKFDVEYAITDLIQFYNDFMPNGEYEVLITNCLFSSIGEKQFKVECFDANNKLYFSKEYTLKFKCGFKNFELNISFFYIDLGISN